MFKVYVLRNEKEYPLYEPLDDEMRIIEPVLEEEMGTAGSFSFKINRGHPNFDKLVPRQSEITLYDNQKPIFYGRMLKPEMDFENMVTVACEGELAYLLDSIQRPFSYSGGVGPYIEKLLEVHNGQVQEERRIYLGTITVTGDDTERELTEYCNTLSVLNKISDSYGGYFRIRHSAGKRYLDYLWDYGGVNEQTIRFGENLLDLTKYVDTSDMITCLIVQGGEEEYQDELGETQTRTTEITSVNNGLDYIENMAASEQYGRIWGYKKFDDVTDPNVLIAKARVYLEETSVLPETIEISAVDLALINTEISGFQLGYWTNIISQSHGINQQLLLSKRSINLLDPTKGSIVLGRQMSTLTGTANKNQTEISDRVEQTAKDASEEINRKVENATTLITGGFGGYVVLDNIDPSTGKKMHPWRILVMNTPDKSTAQNVIQINQNGIGFSTTGINGPNRNAWSIDGNLLADFVSTVSMLADRIRGGTLEVGGKGLGKDGVIQVLDASGNVLMIMNKDGIQINAGKLKAPEIIGGSAEFGDGLFEANEEMVYLGGFMATNAWGRDIFQSFDEQCGMSADPAKKGGFWFWAGWTNEESYDFAVNNDGMCLAQDFRCMGGQDFWQGWTLTETMRDVYRKLDSLQDQIDNIDTGGDE